MKHKKESPRCFSCKECHSHFSTYKGVCPACGGEMEVSTESGDGGVILDHVPVLYPPENLADLGQYVCVLVKLDNGCRMFGIMQEKAEEIKAGIRVRVSAYNKDDKKLFFEMT